MAFIIPNDVRITYMATQYNTRKAINYEFLSVSTLKSSKYSDRRNLISYREDYTVSVFVNIYSHGVTTSN